MAVYGILKQKVTLGKSTISLKYKQLVHSFYQGSSPYGTYGEKAIIHNTKWYHFFHSPAALAP